MAIRKLLVANRGEIALRVFRTCRARGIATVAVATPDEPSAPHARSADQAVEVASYLDVAAIVRAATDAGADAVHPGYGFLAESPELADAVEAAGLVFVGPTGEALRAGGDKLAAKRIARRAGIPVVEDGEPEDVGFPLVIKAAAGGGGRGMRVVREAGELDEALAAARREAGAAFGDERVFCERFVERPRHVEVQVLADAHGGVTHLFERDCSIQRRHQKLLEEAPAPGLPPGLADTIAEAALAFARELGYRGAGTVEFLVEGDAFFFLELNGRIQVEHPVTELVTGEDLVAWQLRIADGERVDGLRPHLRGHAVEARLYAEDPRTFLPHAGTIERLRLPAGVRVDAGVEAGDDVSLRYDPLLAKLVAHGQTRSEALDALAGALAETDVGGVTTNLPFLRWLVAHPSVRAGELTTRFLEEHRPLSPPPALVAPRPWRSPWRLNLPPPAPSFPPDVEAAARDAAGPAGASSLQAPMPGTVLRVLVSEGDEVAARQPLLVLEAMKMETPVVSPHDGVVRRLRAAAGDQVAAGTVLVELDDAVGR